MAGRLNRRAFRLPLSPDILPPAEAPIDEHAKAGLEAFDSLPEDIRAYMKRAPKSFKSLSVAAEVARLGEDLTLSRLKKLGRSYNHIR